MKYSLKGSTHTDIVTRIFENRNVDIENRSAFLNPSRESLQDPSIYTNIDKAFEVYKDCIMKNGKIVVVVDSDADGYCSSATFINYTRLTLGYTNIEFVMHSDKKHGLTPEVMSEIFKREPMLVVLPDAGSSDYKQHKQLRECGIQVIVIDHHECEGYSEDAIVINNQLVEGGNKTLSGAGMVLKFLEYIDKQTGKAQAEYYYDLVAVALVADSMLMTEPETRYYVLEGLDNISNPFLSVLTENMEEGTFEFIGYKIAPVINSVIRVGSDKDKKDLFDAMICEDRKELIKLRGQGEVELPLTQYILKMADRLKSKQTRDIKKILEDEETIIITENYPITFMIHENQDAQPLSGLIASRLVDRYSKPALVLRKVEREEDGVVKVRYDGSARSSVSFANLKDYLVATKKFLYCAGHQGAFGVSIDSKMMKELLVELMHQSLPDEEGCFIVDKAYTDGRVSSMDIISVDELKGYWCKGFDKPQFYIKLSNVRPSDITTMGTGNTVKIMNDYISYIKFKCTQDDLDLLLKECNKDIEIIGTFNVNEWNGRTFPQVFIDHFEVKEVENLDDINFSDFNAFGFAR